MVCIAHPSRVLLHFLILISLQLFFVVVVILLIYFSRALFALSNFHKDGAVAIHPKAQLNIWTIPKSFTMTDLASVTSTGFVEFPLLECLCCCFSLH